MVLNRLQEKRYINKYIKKPISFLIENIETTRKQSEILVICPQSTGSNWLGIQTATLNLFPETTLVFPQYYSHSVYSKSELEILAKAIFSLKFKQVIFSGFPLYFSNLLIHLKQIDPTIITGLIYHGTLSELSGNNSGISMLEEIIRLIKNNVINKIGFVRSDLAYTFQKLMNIKAYEIVLKTPDFSGSPIKRLYHDNLIHIGIFGANTFNKNLHNQVAAALLVENSIVHVLDNSEFHYFNADSRIVVHKPATRKDFINVLASMTINLYASFSESWGQIVTESLALGVPCICSSSNQIFKHNVQLRRDLCIDNFDNPFALSNFIKNTFLRNSEIAEDSKNYVITLQKTAMQRIADFLQT